MNNNNSDEYERKDNVTDDNDGDECLDKDGIDIVQKYLYSDSRIPFGTLLTKLLSEAIPGTTSSRRRVQ